MTKLDALGKIVLPAALVSRAATLMSVTNSFGSAKTVAQMGCRGLAVTQEKDRREK